MAAALQQLQQQQQGEGGGEGVEGAAGRALNLQPVLEQLTNALQGLIDELRGETREEEEDEQR